MFPTRNFKINTNYNTDNAMKSNLPGSDQNYEKTSPSDCLITFLKSLRIEYLSFFTYSYLNISGNETGYQTDSR